MELKDILALAIAAVGAVVALGSLLQATVEYVKRGRMERLQIFFELRRRLKEPELARVAELIDEAKASRPSKETEIAELRLSRIPLRTKRDYLGLFEEVGLAMERKLIEPDVAHYMFGYYALHCATCDAFWVGVSRGNPYWTRFFDFCKAMEAVSKAFGGEAEQEISSSFLRLPGAVGERAPGSAEGQKVTVRIPPVLRVKADGLAEVDVRAETVAEALLGLVGMFPELRWQIFCRGTDLETGELAIPRFLNVYYDDESIDVLDGLETPVANEGTIVLLPNSAGG
jgi:molybdopterin converting factor small subunit